MEVQAIRWQDSERDGGRCQGKVRVPQGTDSATTYDAIMIADFESWKALADYKADTMRENVREYADRLAESRVRVEYER